jgi:hypothetical protein
MVVFRPRFLCEADVDVKLIQRSAAGDISIVLLSQVHRLTSLFKLARPRPGFM